MANPAGVKSGGAAATSGQTTGQASADAAASRAASAAGQVRAQRAADRAHNEAVLGGTDEQIAQALADEQHQVSKCACASCIAFELGIHTCRK